MLLCKHFTPPSQLQNLKCLDQFATATNLCITMKDSYEMILNFFAEAHILPTIVHWSRIEGDQTEI
jgi:hypothetical protein